MPTARAGVQHILVIMDLYSKYVKLKPIKKATSSIIIKGIEEYIMENGPISTILSDNATQFSNGL